jgi:hypothetical protein
MPGLGLGLWVRQAAQLPLELQAAALLHLLVKVRNTVDLAISNKNLHFISF